MTRKIPTHRRFELKTRDSISNGMHILIAPDKFRGSLDADPVCDAIEKGVLQALPDAKITKTALADGGEGTAEILTKNQNGRFVEIDVKDPLGRKIKSTFGLSSDGKVAYVEMANASGLRLLNTEERNPCLTNTFGTGELIAHALEQGAQNIILGIGGSATTDAGTGMAAALGYRFYNDKGHQINPNGGNLIHIAHIDDSSVHPLLRKCKIFVACDVTNPLFGKNGAAYVYGPQKGADEKMVELLDQGLRSFSKVAERHFGISVETMPGAGAAGGLGAGAVWFLDAQLQEGVRIVMEQLRLPEIIPSMDLVITGEGKVDTQTLQGKVVKGLAKICQQAKVPLVLLCGTLEITPQQAHDAGIVYAASVLNRPMDLETAQNEAYERIVENAYYLVNLINRVRN